MSDTVLAAVKVAPESTELREFRMPEVPIDGALMKVEAAGVCGSDPGAYRRAHSDCIMGHENAGTIVGIGSIAAERWGLSEGDRVVVEEYLPCWHCAHCLAGDFRLCAAGRTDAPGALRYGHTGVDVAPSLWGGFAQYVYLPSNAVIHRLPANVTAELASLAVPLSNGVEWACIDGGAGPGRTVLINGAGQQGQGCAIAASYHGADLVIVAGRSNEAARLAMATRVGADATINLDKEDLKERVMELTGGVGVDVFVDTSDDDEATTTRAALDVVSTDRQATILISGSATFELPFNVVKRKYVTVRAYRGHSYHSIERALRYLSDDRFPIQRLCTHQFGLSDVDTAIKATGGVGVEGAIHVSVNPWL
ncbi:MAG TPA: alcohol dehydrogenase catalytic domain-containing protein [Acidimicrobiales bacterium]